MLDDRAGSGGAPASGGAAGAAITVGYLPKDIVNQYFAAAKTGMDKAAAETPGSKIVQVGPNEPKADLQVPSSRTSRPERSMRSSSRPTARTRLPRT